MLRKKGWWDQRNIESEKWHKMGTAKGEGDDFICDFKEFLESILKVIGTQWMVLSRGVVWFYLVLHGEEIIR